MTGLLKNSALLTLGTLFARGAAFVTNVIAARLLSIEVFGQYMLIRSSIAVVDAITTASIGNIALKEISRARARSDRTRTANVVRRLVALNASLSTSLAAGIFFGSDYVLDVLFLGSGDMSHSLWVVAILTAVAPLPSVLQKILIGLESYRRSLTAGVAVSIVSIPMAYLLTNAYGLTGLLSAICGYFALDTLAKVLIIVSEERALVSPDREVLKTRRQTLRPRKFVALAISAGVTASTFWSLRVQTVRDDEHFQSIAAFDAAFQGVTAIMIITGAMTSVALQALASSQEKEGADLRRIFLSTLRGNLGAAVLMSIVYASLAKPIMAIFGEQYVAFHSIVYILCVVAVVATLASLLEKVLISAGDESFLAMGTVIASIACLASTQVFSDSDGAARLGCAYIVFYVSYALVTFWRITTSQEYCWLTANQTNV